MFHIGYDKEYDSYPWLWWYEEKGGFGPDFVSMASYRSKEDCIAAIKQYQRLIPVARIVDPSNPKKPPFAKPGLR